MIFLVLLWAIRYPIVYPLGLLQIQLAKMLGYDADLNLKIGPAAALLLLFVVAPLGETVIECTLPYAIIGSGKTPYTCHPWLFILVSATLLVACHFLIYGMYFAIFVPSAFVTGLFLAYCYARFAFRSHARALFWTSLFHALINIPGYLLLLYDLNG